MEELTCIDRLWDQKVITSYNQNSDGTPITKVAEPIYLIPSPGSEWFPE